MQKKLSEIRFRRGMFILLCILYFAAEFLGKTLGLIPLSMFQADFPQRKILDRQLEQALTFTFYILFTAMTLTALFFLTKPSIATIIHQTIKQKLNKKEEKS